MANDLEQISVDIEARVARYRTDMLDSATVTEKSLTRIENSASKMERQVGRSFGNAAQQSRNLGFQISDIGVQLSSGTSPFIVLAQQGPQVANALEGARGAVGRFATFLSGPLGAAVLAATTIVGVWLSKNKEAGESIDDLVAKLQAQARQAKLNEQANDVFSRSIEGVTKAADDAEKAVEALRLAKKGEAQQTVESIRKNLEDAAAVRAATKARLDQAIAILEIERSGSEATSANSSEALAQQRLLNQRIESVNALRKELDEADKQAARLQKSLNGAISAQTVEQENASAVEKINRKFDAAIDRAAAAANASKKSQDALRAEIALINKAREAELKREADSKRESRRSTSSLPAVTGQEIARALGARVTSGTRSPAENAAARGAKNSYHLSGQAIDIPLTVNGKPLTKAGIRAALEPLGVEIKELLGPGDKGHSDHFHIAFSKKRRGGDEVARSAQQAANDEARRLQSHQNEIAALLGDEIAARRALVESAEEMDRLNLQAIELERQQYSDLQDSLVEQGKLTADEAVERKFIADEIAKYRVELVKRNAQIREFRIAEAQRQRDEQYDSAARADQADILQGQADLARTLDERNEIERKLVDLKYQEEKSANDAVIAAAERLRIEKEAGRASQEALDAANDAARVARLRNASLDERKGNDLEGVDRNNPLDRYLDDTADPKARAEEAAVRELQSVRDGLAEGLAEQLGVKNQFVKDLFSIFLDEVIFRPLAEAMRNKQSGGGGLFGSILSGIGSLFGGGPAYTDTGGMNLSGFRAGGGPVSAGSLYRINENATPGNPEYFRPQGSGDIIPLGRINQRAAQGGGQTIVNQTFVLDARQGITTPQLINYVNQTANAKAMEAGGASFAAGQQSAPGTLNKYQQLKG